MAVFLIGYDLKEGADYEPLWDAIKSIGDWLHPLDSTWFVYTDDDDVTPDTITEDLKPHFEKKQRLFVIQVKRPYQGLLSEKQWDWIGTNMKR